MTEEKLSKPKYFKLTKNGTVLGILKATHSNIAARNFLINLGYDVKAAETDDVVSHVMAGKPVEEIKKTKTARPTNSVHSDGATRKRYGTVKQAIQERGPKNRVSNETGD